MKPLHAELSTGRNLIAYTIPAGSRQQRHKQQYLARDNNARRLRTDSRDSERRLRLLRPRRICITNVNDFLYESALYSAKQEKSTTRLRKKSQQDSKEPAKGKQTNERSIGGVEVSACNQSRDSAVILVDFFFCFWSFGGLMTVVLRFRKDRKETWALGDLGALQLSTIRHTAPVICHFCDRRIPKGWLRLSTQKFTIRYLLGRLFLSLPRPSLGISSPSSGNTEPEHHTELHPGFRLNI